MLDDKGKQERELQVMANGISGIVNARRMQPMQWMIVVLVLIALVIDGVDIQLLSLVAPLILTEWSVSKATFGPAMGAALIGMSIGAGLGGWAGDHFGRKKTLVTAILLFGVTTMAASWTQSTTTLALLRLVTGIGFGAAAPNGLALLSEWLPKRAQSTAIALMSAAIPVGGMIGAVAVVWLIPSYGWRGCFVACGITTLVIGIAIAIFLPESAAFLLANGKRDRADAVLRRVFGPNIDQTVATSTGSQLAGHIQIPPKESMFAPGFHRLNIGIWMVFIGINFIAYAMAAWTPVYLTAAGFSLPQAISVVFVHNLSAVTCAALTSLIIRRVGSRTPFFICCTGAFACVCFLAITLAGANGVPTADMRLFVTVASAGVGGFNGAAIALTYALLAYAYPVGCRARGIGFGIMMGRIGGAAATVSGGALLSINGDSTVPFFSVLALCATVSFIGVFVVNRHVPRPDRVDA